MESDNDLFDLKQTTSPVPVNIAASARVLQGMRLKAPGFCFWVHTVKPKAGAWVEMTAGNAPFLVCGRYGKGTVAVVAGSVMGDTTKARPGFWETNEWVDTLSRVIGWMVFDSK